MSFEPEKDTPRMRIPDLFYVIRFTALEAGLFGGAGPAGLAIKMADPVRGRPQ